VNISASQSTLRFSEDAKLPLDVLYATPHKHFSFVALAKCSDIEALSQGGKGVLRTLLLPVYGPQVFASAGAKR